MAIMPVMIALLIVIMLVASSLAVVLVMPKSRQTALATGTSTGVTSMEVTNANCSQASSARDLPVPGYAVFSAEVNHSGPWSATAMVFQSGAPVSRSCYSGSGAGYILLQNKYIVNNSTMTLLATKLGGGTGTLTVRVNGNSNSTTLPYGTAMVSALACPWVSYNTSMSC